MDGYYIPIHLVRRKKQKKIIIDGGNAPPYKLSLNVNTAETKREK